eukprot:3129323-Lingulodinium_polyedra.AAC.1
MGCISHLSSLGRMPWWIGLELSGSGAPIQVEGQSSLDRWLPRTPVHCGYPGPPGLTVQWQ